jgi:hypothetical protein
VYVKLDQKVLHTKKDSLEYDEIQYMLSWLVSSFGLLDLPDLCCLGNSRYTCEGASTAPCGILMMKIMMVVAGRGACSLTWALINDRIYKVLSLSDEKEGEY